MMLAPGGLHRIVPIRSALKTRKETMSGISRSPVPKPRAATPSGQRTTTSTPNIISGRCPRTEERHRRPCHNDRCYQDRIVVNLSGPSSVTSEDVCHEEQARSSRNRPTKNDDIVAMAAAISSLIPKRRQSLRKSTRPICRTEPVSIFAYRLPARDPRQTRGFAANNNSRNNIRPSFHWNLS